MSVRVSKRTRSSSAVENADRYRPFTARNADNIKCKLVSKILSNYPPLKRKEETLSKMMFEKNLSNFPVLTSAATFSGSLFCLQRVDS